MCTASRVGYFSTMNRRIKRIAEEDPEVAEALEVLDDISAAKRQIEEAVSHYPWSRGVGVGLVSGSRGIIISVAEDAEAEARDCVDALEVTVPVTIRRVGEIGVRDD